MILPDTLGQNQMGDPVLLKNVVSQDPKNIFVHRTLHTYFVIQYKVLSSFTIKKLILIFSNLALSTKAVLVMFFSGLLSQ